MSNSSLSSIIRAVHAGQLLHTGWFLYFPEELDRGDAPDTVIAQPVFLGDGQDLLACQNFPPEPVESPRSDLYYLIVRCGEIMDTHAVPDEGRWILLSPGVSQAARNFAHGSASRKRHYAAFAHISLDSRLQDIENLLGIELPPESNVL